MKKTRNQRNRTSVGLRGGLDGPFFFGRIAILCLAAEWLSLVSESRLELNDISGGNISSDVSCLPISYDDLLVDKMLDDSIESSYSSELVMLNRPNELWC